MLPGSLALLACHAAGQQVNSFADLEIIIEDFEGISLHGGSSIDVPNPFNSVTIIDLSGRFQQQPEPQPR
ncbi:MAG: hypothetical protein JKY96_04260 [Phycisphaerales bacterium]|nr:hypothetical protein [Phycisphaerales bacterium]